MLRQPVNILDLIFLHLVIFKSFHSLRIERMHPLLTSLLILVTIHLTDHNLLLSTIFRQCFNFVWNTLWKPKEEMTTKLLNSTRTDVLQVVINVFSFYLAQSMSSKRHALILNKPKILVLCFPYFSFQLHYELFSISHYFLFYILLRFHYQKLPLFELEYHQIPINVDSK